MKSDDDKEENVLLLHSETIMEVTDNELSCIDSEIIFYVAGFNARSLKKQFKCEECSNNLGRNEEFIIPTTLDVPSDRSYFLDSMNRGGLVKPSDFIF